ncbi:MAG: Blp family class II bacteriocin [Crocosphaera sp.]
MSRIKINDLNTGDSQFSHLSEDDLNEIRGEGWKGALIGAAVGAIAGPVGAIGGAIAGYYIEEMYFSE